MSIPRTTHVLLRGTVLSMLLVFIPRRSRAILDGMLWTSGPRSIPRTNACILRGVILSKGLISIPRTKRVFLHGMATDGTPQWYSPTR